jgi:hypothetical protein
MLFFSTLVHRLISYIGGIYKSYCGITLSFDTFYWTLPILLRFYYRLTIVEQVTTLIIL